MPVPQHPDAQTQYRSLITPNQDLERPDVPARRPLDQKHVAQCAHQRSPTLPDIPMAVRWLSLRVFGGASSMRRPGGLGAPSRDQDHVTLDYQGAPPPPGWCYSLRSIIGRTRSVNARTLRAGREGRRSTNSAPRLWQRRLATSSTIAPAEPKNETAARSMKIR